MYSVHVLLGGCGLFFSFPLFIHFPSFFLFPPLPSSLYYFPASLLHSVLLLAFSVRLFHWWWVWTWYRAHVKHIVQCFSIDSWHIGSLILGAILWHFNIIDEELCVGVETIRKQWAQICIIPSGRCVLVPCPHLARIFFPKHLKGQWEYSWLPGVCFQIPVSCLQPSWNQ